MGRGGQGIPGSLCPCFMFLFLSVDAVCQLAPWESYVNGFIIAQRRGHCFRFRFLEPEFPFLTFGRWCVAMDSKL